MYMSFTREVVCLKICSAIEELAKLVAGNKYF